MQFTATQIAQLLKAPLREMPTPRSHALQDRGRRRGSLSFLANPAYTQYVYDTTASRGDHRQGLRPDRAR